MHPAPPPRLPAIRQKAPPVKALARSARGPRGPQPRAAPISLSVGDQVVINGQLYVVGVALIPFQGPTPTPAPGPAPTPAPGPVVPTPTVNEFRDPTRQFAVRQLTGSANFWIYGANFGVVPGTLTVAGARLPLLHWDDQWIESTAPPFVAGASPSMWTIMRADGSSTGGFYSFMGPAIVQPPPPAGQR